ncbi:hypothetical protein [Limimaricola soesokkakensis]|uniref:hypothetical protein n=1 Tax=Limimaricola soesokkakensis TaxID=1343159 RepID=UPI000A270B67|nr:hypothetical protein [Limimaricola soesokkakensis]
MPKSLDFSRLKQFEAEVSRTPAPSKTRQLLPEAPNSSSLDRQEETSATGPAAQPARWPSRQEIRDGQISIKAPLDTIERFKLLCKSDRRTYADMLDILMTHFEGQGRA